MMSPGGLSISLTMKDNQCFSSTAGYSGCSVTAVLVVKSKSNPSLASAASDPLPSGVAVGGVAPPQQPQQAAHNDSVPPRAAASAPDGARRGNDEPYPRDVPPFED